MKNEEVMIKLFISAIGPCVIKKVSLSRASANFRHGKPRVLSFLILIKGHSFSPNIKTSLSGPEPEMWIYECERELSHCSAVWRLYYKSNLEFSITLSDDYSLIIVWLVIDI